MIADHEAVRGASQKLFTTGVWLLMPSSYRIHQHCSLHVLL
jgi:hypothetical protein